jgi:intracellular septation protein A
VKNVPHGGDVDELLEEVVAARRVGTDPKDLFGGPRDWVDSALPPIGFLIGNAVGDIDTGIWVAMAIVLVEVVVRLVRKETLRHAFSGVFGVAIAAGIAKMTGDADNFFLPGIVINAVYGVVFLLSVVFGHPLVGVVMRLILDKPKEWHDHPLVKRAYAEATVLWAGMFLLRFGVKEVLRRNDQTGLLAIAHIAMGWPLYLAVLGVTLPYVKWRTRSVPEPEPEPGGEDAEQQTA